MRLSTVFELLVIALLVAFMASEARVIDGPDTAKILSQDHRFVLRKDRQRQVPDTVLSAGATESGPSRFCTCASLTCNCCRQFSLPVVPVKGPGCATVTYLRDNVMSVTMSFGDRVLRNITVNSKKPKPVCMPMPGGISKFCGRLYSIKRDGDNFKACLGLELRALGDVEAALRVSCFKFGPSGVNVEPGEALPVDKVKEEEDEDDDDYFGDLDDDDDDDDDDDFGLTGADDDDDDDEDDDDETPPAKDSSVYNDVDSSDSDADYTGFGTLSEELFGGFFGSSGKKKKKPVKNYNVAQLNVVEPLKVQVQPAQAVGPTKTSKPEVQKVTEKKPTKVSPTTQAPTKRTRTTTTAPSKKTKTTPSPVKTLATSTTPTVETSSSTPKPPKRKKKPLRRRPATSKPSTPSQTEATPTVITATAMTVNVVQGGVVLNETMPQEVVNSAQDTSFKIPMGTAFVETKPVQPVEPSKESSIESSPQDIDVKINPATEKSQTETNEVTTQTIMQNTIPIDDRLTSNVHSVKLSTDQQSDEALVEDEKQVNTTPYDEYMTESTTNPGSTVQDVTSNTENYFKNKQVNTAESTDETVAEMTTSQSTSEIKHDMFKNEQGETDFENMASTQSINSVTPPNEVTEEGTDKTEVLTEDSASAQDTRDSSSDEGSQNDEEEDEDDDEDGIDLGADLGLDDDDDEEDESTSEKEPTKPLKPEEKDEDDDDDDILGGLLDDDDDEKDQSEDKGNGKERTLGGYTGTVQERTQGSAIYQDSQIPYQINPMLYRLARVSLGSMATARHLPRFSEGRNRRNNKRMRFSSLDLAV